MIIKDLKYFKNELKETEQNLSTLIENHLKKEKKESSLFNTKRFLNFSTMNFLDYKTSHSFKIVSSENFFDKTKNEDKISKSTTKHQIFFVGNKIIKNSKNKEDLIEEISVAYRLLGFWNKYKSIKTELIALFQINFDMFLATRKLIELDKTKKKDFKEEDSFYFNYLKEHSTEEFKKWDSFIKELEESENTYEKEISEILSDEKENRLNKKNFL